MNKKSKLRIAKFISNAGISSRRGAEKLILEGKVEVNGQLIKSPALNINKDDIVRVDGRIIEYDLSVRMWIFYKPKGCLVTASDPKGRKTIYDILPHSMKNINAVGRLDFNSEGLLLLTNNGDFSRYLELPKNNFERLYKVRVFGKVREDLLLGLSKGIKIDGISFSKKDYYFGIRPEHFHVSDNSEYKFNPKIDLIENLGNEKIAYIKKDNHDISAKIPSQNTIKNQIGFSSKNIFVFDENGNRVRS